MAAIPLAPAYAELWEEPDDGGEGSPLPAIHRIRQSLSKMSSNSIAVRHEKNVLRGFLLSLSDSACVSVNNRNTRTVKCGCMQGIQLTDELLSSATKYL